MAGSDSELHAQSVQCVRRKTTILYSIVQLLFQFIGGGGPLLFLHLACSRSCIDKRRFPCNTSTNRKASV